VSSCIDEVAHGESRLSGLLVSAYATKPHANPTSELATIPRVTTAAHSRAHSSPLQVSESNCDHQYNKAGASVATKPTPALMTTFTVGSRSFVAPEWHEQD
jgi:hypothetical protein